jgi:hypothetical protein
MSSSRPLGFVRLTFYLNISRVDCHSLVGVCVCWLPEDRHFFMLCLLKFDAIGIEIPSLLLGSINSKQFACKADQDIGATVSD